MQMKRPPISALDVSFDDPAVRRMIKKHEVLDNLDMEAVHTLVHGPFIEWLDHVVKTSRPTKNLPKPVQVAAGCFANRIFDLMNGREVNENSREEVAEWGNLRMAFLTGVAYCIALTNRDIDFSQAVEE